MPDKDGNYTIEEQDASPDDILPLPSSGDDVASSWFFYNCSHGASNTPCPMHFPHLFDTVDNGDGTFALHPKPDAVKPDDWMKSYGPQDSAEIAAQIQATGYEEL